MLHRLPRIWGDSDGPRLRRLRRQVGVAHALVSIPILVSIGSGIRVDEAHRTSLALIALTFVVHLCVGFRALRARLDLADVAALTVVLPILVTSEGVFIAEGSNAGTMGLGQLAMTVLLVVAGTYPRIATFLPALIAYAVTAGNAYSFGGTVSNVLIGAGYLVAGGAFTDAIVASGRSADRADQEAADALLLQLTETERVATQNALRRVLHDEVISALRTVADPPGEDGELTRAACREAAEAIREVDR